MSLYLWADIVKISQWCNLSVQLVSLCLFVSAAHYDEGWKFNLLWKSFLRELYSEYALILIGEGVPTMKWQSSWESRWQGHSTHLQSFSIQELKLSVLGRDVIYTPCLLQIGLGSPKVNTRPWLWYYLWY